MRVNGSEHETLAACPTLKQPAPLDVGVRQGMA